MQRFIVQYNLGIRAVNNDVVNKLSAFEELEGHYCLQKSQSRAQILGRQNQTPSFAVSFSEVAFRNVRSHSIKCI